MSPPGGQPDSGQTPGGLWTNIWLGCHQRKNGGWTPGLHLDSAGLWVESNQNMWGSVKSSLFDSVVLMITVQMITLMLEVDLYVIYIIICLLLDA